MIVDYLMMFTKDEGQKLTAAAVSDFRLDFGQPKPTTGYAYGDLVAVFTVKADVTGNLRHGDERLCRRVHGGDACRPEGGHPDRDPDPVPSQALHAGELCRRCFGGHGSRLHHVGLPGQRGL